MCISESFSEHVGGLWSWRVEFLEVVVHFGMVFRTRRWPAGWRVEFRKRVCISGSFSEHVGGLRSWRVEFLERVCILGSFWEHVGGLFLM